MNAKVGMLHLIIPGRLLTQPVTPAVTDRHPLIFRGLGLTPRGTFTPSVKTLVNLPVPRVVLSGLVRPLLATHTSTQSNVLVSAANPNLARGPPARNTENFTTHPPPTPF